MKVRFYDLKGKFECQRRRSYNIQVKKAGNVYGTLRKIEKEMLYQAMADEGRSDIRKAVMGRLSGLQGLPQKQAELFAGDITARIERCVRSFEARKTGSESWAVIDSGYDLDLGFPCSVLEITSVRPDYLVKSRQDGKEKITAYQIRTGKPVKADGTKYKQEDIMKDLQLYALAKYAQDFAEKILLDGTEVEVEGCFLFLQKNSDRNATYLNPEARFDSDLFLDEKGKTTDNVVSIIGECRIGVEGVKELDELYRPALDRYVQGTSPDACTDLQCKGCEFYEACRYTEPPETLPEETEEAPIKEIRLSPTQEAIRTFRTGYALVNAVPGAGKTLVLVLRIVELLNTGVKPEEIAVITFTNSGAKVFKERIARYNDEFGMGEPIDGMTAATFNSFGQSILEKEYRAFGYMVPPKVIDPIERSRIISDLLEEHPVEGLDYRNFSLDMKNYKGALAVASALFDLIKQHGWKEGLVEEKLGKFCSMDTARQLAGLYQDYCSILKKEGLVEYADQENMVLELLDKDPYYFDFHFGFRHILVDEGQDTSERQFRILKHMTMASSFESMMVVGDDSQSIYGFRDTTPQFFIKFEKSMGLAPGEAHVFYMSENFRSTPEIINFSNRLIELNKCRIDKRITPVNQHGAPVTVKGFEKTQDEHDWIASEIGRKLAEGHSPDEIALITYTRTELEKIGQMIEEKGIPTVRLTPERYLDNPRVTAALALAEAFSKILQGGPADLYKETLVYFNASVGGDIFLFDDKGIMDGLQMVTDDICRCRDLDERECASYFFRMLDTIDDEDETYEAFLEMLHHQKSMEGLLSYCRSFAEYGGKAEKRREKRYAGVALTTAHSSKGMEFDIVFNSISKYDPKELEQGDMTEEMRRLLFVSATRAKKELYITGKYISYGGAKNPHVNQFLLDAAKIAGSVKDVSFMEDITEFAKIKAS